MDLSFAFFADNATVPADGKVYVLGGGFSALALPALPGRVTFAVVAGFRFAGEDAGKTHLVELRFLDMDGKLVLPVATLQFQSAGVAPDTDREVSVSTVTYLSPMLGDAGLYTVQFWAGDRPLASLRLTVEAQQAAPVDEGSRPN
ncbi:MAG: hypothetical protein ABR564_05025 [Candidatus Dormibacteria bacterium]